MDIFSIAIVGRSEQYWVVTLELFAQKITLPFDHFIALNI